ncbi:MAG: sulfatase-like hydrolase/transferase, partial [Planctomycetota bacterium]
MSTPNIVLIVADDMGYGDFGCFNYGASRTPALDHLATEGLCLSQHYSACPMCAPARASLYTGRYPHRTGCIDTIEVNGMDRLAVGETTVADLLRRAGYATGLVGKWHNGAVDPRYHPCARGFDEFAGFRAGGMDYFDWRIEVGGAVRKAD